jgi:DNA recombination protein RmuC
MSNELLMAALAGGLLGAVVLWVALFLLRHRSAQQSAQWRADMQTLASQALRENSDVFLTLARETFAREQASQAGSWREREQALQGLIDPIRTALSRTEAQVQTLENERREAFGSLRGQIELLARSQLNLQQETRNLVNALRRPEVRGRWGELTLRRVVELAGLSEHCDFSEQVSVAGARGTQRPDMLVRMPESRVLVVDAKAPIDAFLEAIDAATEEQRNTALARHAAQVEARVRDLASKSYWTQFEHSPEFVVLFLPGDQFLSAALAQRPELLETAISQRVILATPSTLIALLKTIAHGWRQHAVAENAAAIRDLGQELHQRLSVFVGHLARSGRQLGSAVEAYNQAIGSLERLVLPAARRFTELKAVSSTPIASPEPIEQLVRSVTAEAGSPP